MISSEAQRTLVKSPPELWSELSELSSLARHLDELGEIRITRLEPESTVQWEGDSLSGTVKLEPSGWGTKVTLTIDREPPPAGETASAEVQARPPAQGEAEAGLQARPPAQGEAEATPEPPAAAGEPAAESSTGQAPETERPRRRGFLERIFSSLRTRSRDQLLIDEAIASEPEPADEREAEAEGQRQDQPRQPDPGAELAQLEAQLAARDEALLVSMLDRLGAAHHRPFSRA
jgi:hypothetical protein